MDRLITLLPAPSVLLSRTELGQVPQRRVPALLVVEHLDVVEQLCLGRWMRLKAISELEGLVENQLSIAALSWALPLRLMLQVMPCAASTRW